jgi:hypothetical protein
MGSKSSKLVAAALAAASLTVVASPVAHASVNLQAEQRAAQAAEAAQHPGNGLLAEQRATQANAAAQHSGQAVRVDLRSPDARDAAASRTIGTIRPATVQSPAGGGSPSSGFDWGDAGIGAGGTVGLLLLGIGGTVLVGHRRPREMKRSGQTLAS